MYISKEQLQNACTLSIADVCAALDRQGYKTRPGEITGIEFKGMSPQGSFIYEIFGPDPEGGDDISIGNVYLQYQRRPLSTVFELYGDY